MSKVMMYDDEADEIAICTLEHPEYGHQIWRRIKTRESWTCRVTGDPIPSRTRAYRPLTNGYNRMHRISAAGMLQLARRAYRKAIRESGDNEP